MSSSSNMTNAGPSSVSPRSSAGPSNLSLNLVIHYIDQVLSAITNKDVVDSGTKLRDLVQPVASDLSNLLEGISEGAKMLSNQKFLTSKLSTEAQTMALDVLRGLGNAHWAAVGLLVIANVLDRFDRISANDTECIDLLKSMLNLGKYLKQLKDNHFDLHREILEKMSEAVQLIVSGAILCHSFIRSNKISKFLLTMKIREELVAWRGKLDNMKSDLRDQMQILIMTTLTLYISTSHDRHDVLSRQDPGGIEEINSFTLTEEWPSQQANDVNSEIEQRDETEMYGSESETGSSNRQEINDHGQPETAPSTFLGRRKFLERILPRIFRTRRKDSPCMRCKLPVTKIQPSAIEFTGKELLSLVREVIGKGSFSTVYFATLRDGRKVAVKKISGLRSKEMWENELAVLSRKQHPNILTLVGYCFKDDLMLVYEYMAGGNLSEVLLGGENRQIMDWPARFKIILDIIRGLVYLNEGADGCVVHRDIKPNNILLDEHFNAKISDFGISYVWPDGGVSPPQYTQQQTWTDGGVSPPQYGQDGTTHLAGTVGYIDPQYMMTGYLTKKTDIYSFGMLLLNIVSGKKAVQHTDDELDRLEEQAWRLHGEDRLTELIDPGLDLSSGSNLSEILRTTVIALWCIQKESKVRPSASQVLHMLSSQEEIPTPPAPIESHFDYGHYSEYEEDHVCHRLRTKLRKLN